MATTPEYDVHDTISMVVDDWKESQIEQFSPVVRIGEYPWRLRLYKSEIDWKNPDSYTLAVLCDKSTEAELWACKAFIWVDDEYEGEQEFLSWNDNQEYTTKKGAVAHTGETVSVVIATTKKGDVWGRRPTVDFFAPRDGVIEIGEEKIKLHVNIKSLTSESQFFYRSFIENNTRKSIIEDVEYEEFSNVIKLFYGLDGASITDKNVLRVLQLAHRFKFKIVKDRIVSFFLSSDCSLPAYTKLVYYSMYSLPFTEEYFEESDDELQEDKEENVESEGRMAVSSVEKVSGKISMAIDDWEDDQNEQFSPVVRIGGYPWRLRLYKGCKDWEQSDWYQLEVICEKSSEAELYACEAAISHKFYEKSIFEFNSWERSRVFFKRVNVDPGSLLSIEVTTSNDGENWRRRSSFDYFDLRDGILLIGNEKKIIPVNKKSLAAQSPYFDRLFNISKKNVVEFPIEDVEYEEFCNIIRMIYGLDGASLTNTNIRRVLELAEQFELKIIEDRVVSYLFSSECTIDCEEVEALANEYNLNVIKEFLASGYIGVEFKLERIQYLIGLEDCDRPIEGTVEAKRKRRSRRRGGRKERGRRNERQERFPSSSRPAVRHRSVGAPENIEGRRNDHQERCRSSSRPASGKKVHFPRESANLHFWDEGYNPLPIERHNSVSDSTFIDGISLGKKSKSTDKLCRSLVKKCNLY